VVGRGVDSQRFAPQQRSATLRRSWGVHDDGTPVLLHVGRLAPEKNVELVLRCWQALRRQQPGLRLVVVGDGPLRRALAAAHPGVLFTGMLQGDALARCYASADLFLFPSLTDTFGNVLLEALASGLSVVSFDMAAAALHVRHARSGWLATPGDAIGYIDTAWQALAALAPGGPAHDRLRQLARLAALEADWDSQLAAFERGLRQAVAAHRAAGVVHAALA